MKDDLEILSWLPGEPLDTWSEQLARLDDLSRIVRQLHDLTSSLTEQDECAVHDDLQPRNVVVNGEFVGLVDWEQLRAGRRVEDVSQLCWSFAGPTPDEPVADVADRWRRVLDAYGLPDRHDVVDTAVRKVRRCIDDISRGGTRDSVRHERLHDRSDRRELEATLAWLLDNGEDLAAAITS